MHETRRKVACGTIAGDILESFLEANMQTTMEIQV
jgi:hypothetical protein